MPGGIMEMIRNGQRVVMCVRYGVVASLASLTLTWSSPIEGHQTENHALKLESQASKCAEYLLKNISPAGAAVGAIVASPSKSNPDYFYHWVRDAALVSRVFVRLWSTLPEGQVKQKYMDEIKAILAFSRKLQLTPNKSNPWAGEPKFKADGTPIDEEWGRPQSDGQPLLGITYIEFLNFLDTLGIEPILRHELYDTRHPSASVIRSAVEYSADEWSKPSFDVWEEELGIHFYNLKVQRTALLMGAWLADRHGEPNTAAKYRDQAAAIRERLQRDFWDPKQRILVATSQHNGGYDYKKGMDSVVILAINHSANDLVVDDVFPPTHEYVLSTVYEQERVFADLYPINKKGYPAIAIGRYPEDKYDGYSTKKDGNPWVLTTNGFGELYFRAALEWKKNAEISITPISRSFFESLLGTPVNVERLTPQDTLFNKVIHAAYLKGEAYLRRVLIHAKADGHFDEQIWRLHGDMTGAPDLTWSYASYLTAYWNYLDLGQKLRLLANFDVVHMAEHIAGPLLRGEASALTATPH